MHELTLLARQVLLDAIEALGAHRDAIVLVGAQAVYLHVGDADLAVAPYTTDGDLVLDPAALGEIPPLERALLDAGFLPKKADSVGIWITYRPSSHSRKTEVAIDLLVPEGVSPGKGRRAARLAGHDARAARKVVGLEGALVDNDRMKLGALAEGDDRVFEVRVAGPAALLVAKLLKIRDRRETARLSDKDALDLVRILRGVETADLGKRMRRLLLDPRSETVAREALHLLESLFGRRTAEGIEMAIRSTGGMVDADELAVSCELLVRDLLDALR